MARDDFPTGLKVTLAARVNYRCSNPGCRAPTSGPQDDPSKAMNLGVAAHITAASAGGPRYDASLAQDGRSSIENAIWLCQNCAKLIDSDLKKYTVDLLRHWKESTEAEAQEQIGKAAPAQAAVEIVDKWVSFKYPEQAGITAQLDAEGYKCSWSSAKNESERVDLEGYEYVLIDDNGRQARLKIQERGGGYLVLLKRKK